MPGVPTFNIRRKPVAKPDALPAPIPRRPPTWVQKGIPNFGAGVRRTDSADASRDMLRPEPLKSETVGPARQSPSSNSRRPPEDRSLRSGNGPAASIQRPPPRPPKVPLTKEELSELRKRRREQIEREKEKPRIPIYPTLAGPGNRVPGETGTVHSSAPSASERSERSSPVPSVPKVPAEPRKRFNPETGNEEVWEPIDEASDNAQIAEWEAQALLLRARITGDGKTPLNLVGDEETGDKVANLIDQACYAAAMQGSTVVDLTGVPGHDPKVPKQPY